MQVDIVEIAGYAQKQFIELMRVSYGLKSTPIEKREYRINKLSPVGTQAEWLKWFTDNHHDKKYNGLVLRDNVIGESIIVEV